MSEEEQSAQDSWDDIYNVKPFSEGEQVSISSLFYPSGGCHLLRNNGDEVPLEALQGNFTPLLVQAYNELAPDHSIEIVFLSCDGDVPSSEEHFSTMPSSWLAFPFYENIFALMQKLAVVNIPHLVFFSDDGELLCLKGVQIVSDYGAAAFPFSSKMIEGFIEEERRNQTIRSILATKTRDFLISSDGTTVPVSDLEGKTVGLYFWSFSSSVFTRTLADVYRELKERGELLEIVMIMPIMERDYWFSETIQSVPWLAFPLNDTKCSSLIRYFELSTSPNLTIIGPDGQTLNPDAMEAVTNYESLAFPFTPGRIAELDEIRRARDESQTLETLLVSGDRNFAIDKDGSQIAVSSLEGKTVMLYFSEIFSGDQQVLFFLKEAYRALKAKEAEFEVVFVSFDISEEYFKLSVEEMPWLALPFGDERSEQLREYFKVRELPMVVTIGGRGKTVAKDARKVVVKYGAHGYPYTEERAKEVEEEMEEKRKDWPEKTIHSMHIIHELQLSCWGEYKCERCNEDGELWSYICSRCHFFLHPNCALTK